MEKYKNFETILTNLNILRYIVYSKVKIGLYDTNKMVEGFYNDLLNLVYGWKLEDKNKETLNYPGIDLGCDTNRIGVQVTSQNNHTKIDKTLEKFDKYCSKDYDRLIVFIITKKSNHSKDFKSNVSFDKDNDIIDVDDLLTEIEKKNADEIKFISNFIKAEIPYYIGKITNEKDILRNRVDYKNVKPRNFGKFQKEFEEFQDDFEEFKDKCMDFHKNLLFLSQKQRNGLLVFLTKCDLDEMEMNINTWGDILESSFGFEQHEIRTTLDVIERQGFLYNDEGDPPSIKPYDIDFWRILFGTINEADDLHDFIMNVNFALIDN